MINIIKRNWPLIISISILWVTIMVLLVSSVRQNQNHLIYTLDDAYIHMSIAKNIAQYGVWGATKYSFSSSSSSPLWILLLSLIYYLFGANEIVPFILNLIFATLFLTAVFFLLKKYISQLFYVFMFMLAIIFFTPMPAMIFCGMEHTLQILLTVLFVYYSVGVLTDKKRPYPYLLLTASFMTLVRYEFVFLVFTVNILLIFRRKFLQSLCLGVTAFIPILIYGTYSILNGWHFFPNSVLLKSDIIRLNYFNSLIFRNYNENIMNPSVLFLIVVTLIIFIFNYFHYYKQRGTWKDSDFMVIVFIGTAFLQVTFAKVDYFFRYEAYLVSFGILTVAVGIYEYLIEKFSIGHRKFKYKIILIVVILLFILPFGKKAISLKLITQATTDIYGQQYQMGLFLKEFYRKDTVAVNDIGAINYLADIKCIDLLGLASLEVEKLIRTGNYNTKQIYDLAKQKNVKIAIVYDQLFGKDRVSGMPSQWIKVGQWKILENVVCARDTVSFYAVDQSEAHNLMKNLNAFSSHLPRNVVQLGKYNK